MQRCNQLKSVTGRVFTGKNETESGLPIHAMFGYASISDRIVGSPELIGTTATLLQLVTQRVLDAYDNK